jgi:2-polyprenyl-6-methoxyphenol hydroxylase-like FAD-dependent oxidoreductase
MKVCVVGGGPAGMMLGFLLARAGVEVAVLEKHKDFLRDFRGDTVHPSTIELMSELGLLEQFLAIPHNKVERVGACIEDEDFPIADFTALPVKCPYIAFLPQWDFLDFLSAHAKKFPKFHLHLQHEVTGLIEENGRITGVQAKSPEGPVEFRADLVVGADGRSSIVRQCAGLEIQDIGAPMDVLWMRISRKESDPAETLGRIKAGHFMFMINRNSYWQCAFLIPKGALDHVKAQGLEKYRQDLARVAPFLSDRLNEIDDWDNVKLLTVKVDRLKTWHRSGLLCIGDSAHAMSPIGGVGINLAIQDAVATSNILTEPLLKGTLGEDDLAKVQQRRTMPTVRTQAFQVFAQKRIVQRAIGDTTPLDPPFFMRLTQKFPYLRRFPARMIGIGFRPEHIETKAAV